MTAPSRDRGWPQPGVLAREVAVGTVKRAQLDDLRDAVIASLQAGIDAKGASIDDPRDPYGVQGSFQDQFLVHLGEGRPCPRCETTIVKLRAAGRGTLRLSALPATPATRYDNLDVARTIGDHDATSRTAEV